MSDSVGPLEDRLRGMILHHEDPPPPAFGPLLDQAQTQTQTQTHGLSGQQAPGSPAGATNSQGPKKRLNQAQRRQMSAELTIPIHHRRHHTPPSNSYGQGQAGALGSPPTFSTGNTPQPFFPPANAFPPPDYRGPAPNQPGAAMSFPSPPRHYHHNHHHHHHQPPFPNQQDLSRPHFAHAQGGPSRPMMKPGQSSPHSSRAAPRAPYPPARSSHIPPPELLKAQADMLEDLCNTVIAGAEIKPSDIMEKEKFRIQIEQAVRTVITQYELNHYGHAIPDDSVQLKCFGSLASGFATKAADMDLGLLSPLSQMQPDDPASPIPRLIEKTFLDMGFGARLLTRTRVPIIKICEKPSTKLRQGLLRERAKWEAGVPDDIDDEDVPGDAHESAPGSAEEEEESSGKLSGEKILSEDDATAEQALEKDTMDEQKEQTEQKEHTTEPEANSHQRPASGRPPLRQGKGQSLASYYNLALRYLGSVGARDFTKQSHLDELEDIDLWRLNAVSLAFVDGLADETIRQRLIDSATLNRKGLETNAFCRSLLSVYYQAEGETLIKQWEDVDLRCKAPLIEQLEQRRIAEWRQTLRNSTAQVHIDPLAFTRGLQTLYEGLRSTPTFRILSLEQGKFESAASYHQRAIKAMQGLGERDVHNAHDAQAVDDAVLALAIRQYVSGIYSHDICQAVETFASSQNHATLQAIAQRHGSLQMAREYERAIERDLYAEEYVSTIKAYIDILRGPVSIASPADEHLHHFVSIPPDFLPAMSQIRQLGDPALLQPNQPRDRYLDRLEFPKSGAGVQCDINFSAHLALQNTLLLRCYSFCDPRVRPLVLFVKHWAKARQINTPYRGTLSSYGYVLMVLHYLVNVAEPFVCPNLQQLGPQKDFSVTECKGSDVRFWRDEAEITRLAAQNALTQNRDSVGTLLRGFFEYYAQMGPMSTVKKRGFHWGRDVLSLRTPGGLLTKGTKGWTGAKTVIEVKHLAAPPQLSPAGPVLSTGPSAGPEQQQRQIPGPSSPSMTAPGSADIMPPPTASPTRQDQVAKPATTREVKEVRHRFLFAIEDPFELEHNVARTVTHFGIIAIRDEFRRAWRIIQNVGNANTGAGAGTGSQEGQSPMTTAANEDLLLDVSEAEAKRVRENFAQLLRELHGTTAGS